VTCIPLNSYQLPGGTSRRHGSSLTYSLRYARSSRLAIRAPRSGIWSFFSGYRPLCLTREVGMAPNVATAMQSGTGMNYWEIGVELLNEDWSFESGPSASSTIRSRKDLRSGYPPLTEDREPGSPCPPNQPKQPASHTPQGTWPAGPGEKPPPIEQVRPDSASGQPPKRAPRPGRKMPKTTISGPFLVVSQVKVRYTGRRLSLPSSFLRGTRDI
jgi:hypothetical protein